MTRALLLTLMMGFICVKAIAQTDTIPVVADTVKYVEILNADRNGYRKVDTITQLHMLAGHVSIRQAGTLFNADSAVQNSASRTIEAFGNVHINDRDSVLIYSDYLLYYIDTRMAYFKKKVKLTDNTSTVTTEEMQYDLNQKVGQYHNYAKVTNGRSVLTSKEGIYYADLKDIYFRKNVHLKDPEYVLDTDSLLYNSRSQLATFITNTKIVDTANRKIFTKEGFYDMKNKKAYFGKRANIIDGATFITADDIKTDEKTGKNLLIGNAVYKDTSQGMAVLANRIEYDKINQEYIATQKPLLILKQEADSIFITADTLYSGKLSKLLKNEPDTTVKILAKGSKNTVNKTPPPPIDSTDRYFKAYRNVRVFSDSLQAVADSLFFSAKDSIFQLMQEPIVWNGDNQITGDTILLYTRNRKPEKLYVFENGLLVNLSDKDMYNQISGNRITGFFKDGLVDYFRAKGNAESIYYIKSEDSSLVGMNRAMGDMIDLRFQNRALNKVVFISEVKATMYPILKLPADQKQLQNFQWLEAKRPRSRFELLGD